MNRIEKSGFRRHVYIGYCEGYIYRIEKQGKNTWEANPIDYFDLPIIRAKTLRAINKRLDALGQELRAKNIA